MLRGGLSAALGLLLAIPSAPSRAAEAIAISGTDRDKLAVYARDTWRSMDALAGDLALPADSLTRTASGWKPADFTSPTNIAAYLWSTLAAEDLKLITRDDSSRRLARTLKAVQKLDRSHGFFFNWYDPRTGDRLRSWPGGGPIRPFLSSVDNGWLAASLMMVANARPEQKAAALAILGPMNFHFFYDPFDAADPSAHPGLLWGGFFPEEAAYTSFHYGTLNTEPRIASYVGIARGDIPADHYYRMRRGDRDTSASSPTRTYLEVPVVEGSRDYRGTRLVPSWDGTMFEALMVPLFVPEADWAAGSWGRNHPRYAQAQIEAGLRADRLGFWGVSASCDADGGYSAFGVPGLGMSHKPRPSASIVTPHASFLALAFAPGEAMENLRGLAEKFPIYGDFGFLDAVDVRRGRVAEIVLTLDQGMILAAIANVLADNSVQKALCLGAFEAAIRPVIAPERFALEPETLAIRPLELAPTLLSVERRATRSSSSPADSPGAIIPAANLTGPPKRKRRTDPGAASRTSRRAPAGGGPPPGRRLARAPRGSGRGSPPRPGGPG